MKKGWRLVATLGAEAPGFPHVLVDAYGWCLRLGRERGEEKFYSNLPSLLQGLIEQLIRTRFRHGPTLLAAESMLAEVRAALEEAAKCRESLARLSAMACTPAGRSEHPASAPGPITAL